MALLDQLFRLRGAPQSSARPVTLGALATALKRTDAAAGSSALLRHGSDPENPAPPQPVEPPVPAPLSQPEPPRPAPVPDPEPVPGAPASHRPPEPNRSPERGSALRFNPFAKSSDQVPASRAAGPCLDDPTLPPLQLEARVTDAGDRPVILGAIAPAQNGGESAELRQIEVPSVRLAPIKAPARQAESPPPPAGRPLLLRLEIQADPALDVVAFKQHAASFPGVIKCVISNAGD